MDIFVVGFGPAEDHFAGNSWLSGLVQFVVGYLSNSHYHGFGIDIYLDRYTRPAAILCFIPCAHRDRMAGV